MMATYGKMKSVHYPDVETWSLTVTHDDWNEAIPVGEERNVDRLLAELEALRARAEQAEAENARLVELVELAKTVAQAHVDDMEQEPLLGDFAILTKISELAPDAHASVAATDGTEAEPRYEIISHFGAPAIRRISDMRIVETYGAIGQTLDQAKLRLDELNADITG
jgi:hypothetical protein